ncbi:MAG: aconitase X catalytic domain-containing protein [Candidatus Diapherotrites archaeon]|nr:aconitase X catalytic domain-containing protein [Candidatus Diapherotrites archaeon]
MYLTKEEEKMLEGEFGETARKAMNLLVRLGDIYGAEKMVEIQSAQAAGVSYKTIGDAGLEFLEGFADEGARVRVPCFMNPAGMDLKNHREMNVPEEFAKKQVEIVEAFRKLGVVTASTCTPYLAGNPPLFGSHLAWSESSAVSFANSVAGARTNREGGPSALAAAIIGKTPCYGKHLDENRVAEVLIEVSADLVEPADFGALGHIVGKIAGKKVPAIKGIKKATINQLKMLGAAAAASGAVALYHVEGITPEAIKTMPVKEGFQTHTVEQKDLKNAFEELTTTKEDVDLIAIGCPHCSITELGSISEMLDGKRLEKEMWVCTSIAMKALSDRMGYTKKIEESGAKLVCDTCMVVSPIHEIGFRKTATNSGKAANYLPSFNGQKVEFDSVKNLIERYSK